MHWNASFRTKLQTLIVAISGITLLLFGIEARQSTLALKTGKEAQIKMASESLIDKIDRNLFERYSDAQAYAISEPARSGDRKRIESFMNEMVTTYAPVYDLMIVANSEGKVIATNSRDKHGKKIDTSSLIGKDYSSEKWFQSAIRNEILPRTSFVEDPQVDHDVARVLKNSGRVMNFTAPIRDKETGKVLGVWTNRMSWDDVISVMIKKEVEEIKNERVPLVLPYLLNSEGIYLYHPLGPEYEFTHQLEKAKFQVLKEKKTSWVGETEIQSAQYTGSGIESIGISRGYSSYPLRGWSAILKVPASDSQIVFNNQMIALAVIALIFANGLAFWVIRNTNKAMERVVFQLNDESTQLKASAKQIKLASHQLSHTTTQQASAVGQTVTSMEEIASMLGQSHQQASQSLSIGEEGKNEAWKGKQVITRMTGAMEEIQSANIKLDELVRLIGEISNKTRVINDIVFETRLLSFNASIEAARAGSQGKGFAVVAEEVGKLAAISGKAADEIRDLLQASTQEVSRIVDETRTRVAQGREASKECEITFNRMGDSLERIGESIHLITHATSEQEIGIRQTNQAMNIMREVMQTNTHNAENLAVQSVQLLSGANTLRESIHFLEGIMFGSRSEHPSHRENFVEEEEQPSNNTAIQHQQPLTTIEEFDSHPIPFPAREETVAAAPTEQVKIISKSASLPRSLRPHGNSTHKKKSPSGKKSDSRRRPAA